MKKLVWILAGAFGLGALTPAQAAATLDGLRITEVNCAAEYVEIYNPSSASVPLKGLVVTDKRFSDNDPLHRYTAPVRAAIGAKKYLVIRKGANGLPFGIKCGDDRIRIGYKAGKWVTVDEVAVANHTSEVSWGINSKGVWQPNTPTPGKANLKAASGIAVDQAAWLYKPSTRYEIKLEIPQESLNELSKYNVNDYFSKEYQLAYFQVVRNDNSVYPTEPMAVGLRLKIGFGSRQPLSGKPGLKIKFNTYDRNQTFFGLKKMTLNNFAQDPSRLNETLGYELFRSYGIPAPRTGYTDVVINGTSKGRYLNLEVMDDVAMSWWLSDMEHVYEAIWDGGQKPDLDIAKADSNFEVDEGSNNRNALYNMLRTMEYSFGTRNAMEPLFDVQKAATMMAIEKYISHWDGYSGNSSFTPNNFYLSSDSKGKFYLMPGGLDQAFGVGGQGEGENFSRSRLPIGSANGALFKKCLKADYCASTFRRVLLGLDGRIADLKLRLKAAEYVEVAGGGDQAFADFLEFLDTRGEDVDAYLENKLNPQVRWLGTQSIKSGGVVTPEMLNAYSDVPGTFKYSVKPGAKLPFGTTKVKVTFTPSNSDFAASTATKTFQVKR